MDRYRDSRFQAGNRSLSKQRRLARVAALAAVTLAILNAWPVSAGIIFESAQLGPPHPAGDGYLLSASQFLGARFEITERTQVTAVGGHIRGIDGTLFAVIERLSGRGAMPSGSPFGGATVASTVFSPPLGQNDISTPLNATLTPGTYALIFGTELFGASGFALMPFTNIDFGGVSYFHWRGEPSSVWVDGGISNTRFVVLGFVAPPLEVVIDIKPGSFPNSINLSAAGVIPVAILSSGTFDATTVAPDTITIAGAAVRVVGRGDKFQCSFEDVNGDGLADLLCKVENMTDFLTIEGESIAVLEAETLGGEQIRGQDSVRIVPD